MAPDDVFVIETPGGGGYGEPATADDRAPLRSAVEPAAAHDTA